MFSAPTEPKWPERIICLTEETTEALYMMEEDHRIIGISAYTLCALNELVKKKLK